MPNSEKMNRWLVNFQDMKRSTWESMFDDPPSDLTTVYVIQLCKGSQSMNDEISLTMTCI